MTSVIFIYITPNLNRLTKEYENLITVGACKPKGPLGDICRRFKLTTLSAFKTNFGRGSYSPSSCLYAVQRLAACGDGADGSGEFMVADEMPALFQFLIGRGYVIDTQLTRTLNQSDVRINTQLNQTLICVARI